VYPSDPGNCNFSCNQPPYAIPGEERRKLLAERGVPVSYRHAPVAGWESQRLLRNAGRPHLSHRSLREPAGRSWADRRPGGYSRQPPLRSRRSPSRRSQSGSCLKQELGVEAHVSFEAIIHPATRSYKAKGKRPPRWAAACPLSPSPTLHSPRATGGDGRPRWMPCRTVPIAPEDRGAVAAPSPPDVADRLSPSLHAWCFPMCCV